MDSHFYFPVLICGLGFFLLLLLMFWLMTVWQDYELSPTSFWRKIRHIMAILNLFFTSDDLFIHKILCAFHGNIHHRQVFKSWLWLSWLAPFRFCIIYLNSSFYWSCFIVHLFFTLFYNSLFGLCSPSTAFLCITFHMSYLFCNFFVASFHLRIHLRYTATNKSSFRNLLKSNLDQYFVLWFTMNGFTDMQTRVIHWCKLLFVSLHYLFFRQKSHVIVFFIMTRLMTPFLRVCHSVKLSEEEEEVLGLQSNISRHYLSEWVALFKYLIFK